MKILISPTKKHGFCRQCKEANRYTAVNCIRCDARLPWAFLIDGKDDTPVESSVDKLFSNVFGSPKNVETIRCRFCDKTIPFEARVCTHCGNFLASAAADRVFKCLVHPAAPEILELLRRNNIETPFTHPRRTEESENPTYWKKL